MKRLAILAIVAGALLAPATAFGGVVLKVQPAKQLVAVAQPKAKVVVVRTASARSLHVGERVAMHGRRLRVLGRAHTVRFRGVLLARDQRHVVVSAGGALINVGRRSNDDPPAPGTTIVVTATVGGDDDLAEDTITPVSVDHPGGALEGRLTLGTSTITVASEHIALVIAVPAGVDLSAFRNGDEVLAQFAQQADGSLLLTSLALRNHEDDEDDDDGGHDRHGGDDGGGGGNRGPG
jgi:hypothetical protein